MGSVSAFSGEHLYKWWFSNKFTGESSLLKHVFSGGHVLHLFSKDELRSRHLTLKRHVFLPLVCLIPISVNLFLAFVFLVEIRSLQTFLCQEKLAPQDAKRSQEVKVKMLMLPGRVKLWGRARVVRSTLSKGEGLLTKKTRCWIGESKHSGFLLFQGYIKA